MTTSMDRSIRCFGHRGVSGHRFVGGAYTRHSVLYDYICMDCEQDEEALGECIVLVCMRLESEGVLYEAGET
jgi:hypothetical protein